MAKTKTTMNTAETMDSAFHNGTETLKEGFEKAAKGYDRIISLTKDNSEALLKSANVASKGVETINSEVLAFSRKRMEDGVTAAKAIFGAKSFNEAIELQAEYVRTAFEAHLAQFSRLSQIAVETAKGAAEPISARAQVVAELMQDEAA
jgi:phasin family protein